MLQLIRSKAGTFFAKILFVLLIGCFGLWGVSGFLRQTPNDSAIIQVGDIKIKAPDIQEAVDRGIDQMKPYFGGTIDRSQAKQLGIVDRAVNDLVDRALFDQEITRLGLSVGDDQIAAVIQADPTFHDKSGKFNRDLFDELLAQHKLNENMYMGLLRQQVPRQDLLEVVAGNPVTPKTLADLLYRKRAEKRVVDYVFLNGADLPNFLTPDDKTLRAYYNSNISRFTAPEYRRLTLLPLTTADVINQVTVSDDKLQDFYQQNLEEFSKEETRNISHMLLPDEATARKAAAALAKGAAFDTVAQTIARQDPDTIKLGWIARRTLPAELAGPAFAAKIGVPSAPIQTEFGWSILLINAIQPAHTESFDEAKPEILREAKQSAASDALYELSNKVEDATAAGADLSAIAQQFNLKPVTVGPIDATGRAPDQTLVTGLPIDTDSFTKLAFQTAQGQMSALTQTNDGKFFLVRVDGITLATPKPFAQIKGEVAIAWAATQHDRALRDNANALASAITPTRSLAALAVARHLTLGTTQAFARDDTSAASPLPTGLIAQIFNLKPGQSAVAGGQNGNVSGQFVVQLRSIEVPDPIANAGDVAELGQEVGKQLSAELLQAFNNSLRTRFPVKINQPALDALF